MSLSTSTKVQRDRYTADAVMSATPMRLLTMLYDRLLLDLDRAEAAHASRSWAVASTNLLHAQDIIAELTSSLKIEAWDGGERLLALYTYLSGTLVTANVHRDTERIREAVTLLEPLRQAWHEAAGQMTAHQPSPPVTRGGMLGVA